MFLYVSFTSFDIPSQRGKGRGVLRSSFNWIWVTQARVHTDKRSVSGGVVIRAECHVVLRRSAVRG